MPTPIAETPVANTRSINAAHSGTCAICEERYPKGEPLISSAYGWAHAVCPEPRPLGAVCASCFTEIASNGECLC